MEIEHDTRVWKALAEITKNEGDLGRKNLLKHLGNTERKNVGGSTLEAKSPIRCLSPAFRSSFDS
jgi:hypothetical protein